MKGQFFAEKYKVSKGIKLVRHAKNSYYSFKLEIISKIISFTISYKFYSCFVEMKENYILAIGPKYALHNCCFLLILLFNTTLFNSFVPGVAFICNVRPKL